MYSQKWGEIIFEGEFLLEVLQNTLVLTKRYSTSFLYCGFETAQALLE
jgi:hypothetical protein